MKRKMIAMMMASALCVSMVSGCGSKEAETPTEAPAAAEESGG